MFCVYTFTQASCQYLFHWSNASVRIFSNSALVSIPFIYRQHVHVRVCACEYRLYYGMKLIIEPSFSLLSPPASAFPAEAISKIYKSAQKNEVTKDLFLASRPILVTFSWSLAEGMPFPIALVRCCEQRETAEKSRPLALHRCYS